jgi:hypothetical protein
MTFCECGPRTRAPGPSGIAFFGTRPPARKRRSGRFTFGKRTRELASGASEMGQEETSRQSTAGPIREDNSAPGGPSEAAVTEMEKAAVRPVPIRQP